MAVATDDPHWGRNRNMAHAPQPGDEAAMPRSAAAGYARATMPNPPPQMPRYAPPPPPVRETAASRYGATPRAPEPAAAPQYPPHYQPAYQAPYQPPYQAGYQPGYEAAPQPVAPDYAPDPAAQYSPAGYPAAPAPAGPPTRVAALAQNVSRWTRYAGAAASVALVLGVAWWSYQLLMRDVNGLPVVRAMEGPMRIAPENPGGEVSADTGLAVNAIAALGTTAPPEEELALAPLTSGLTEEDLSVAVQPPQAGELANAAEATDVADFTVLDAQATPVAAAPAAAPVTEQPAAEQPAAVAEAPVAAAPATAAPAAAPRPQPRPAARAAAAAPAEAPAAPAPQVNGPLPSGTPLVQFGAYDSLELASGEWGRLQGRFAALIEGKNRVIQEASSGGRVFFRLRATGFADLAEARRFCSAMVAEGAECIPTVEP